MEYGNYIPFTLVSLPILSSPRFCSLYTLTSLWIIPTNSIQHCCETSWKAMLRVLPPSFKPVLKQPADLLQDRSVVGCKRSSTPGPHQRY